MKHCFGGNINFKTILVINCLLSFKLTFSTDFEMEQESKSFQFLSDSCSHFSSNLFQALSSEQNKENIVSSSLSAHIVLSLLFHGAKGVTKEELKSGLHLSDADQLQTELKYLFTSLNNVEDAELEMANSMYVDNDFILLEDFLTKSKNNFQTSVEKMNSKNSIVTADQINTWVKEKTRGKIFDIISSDDIDEYTKVILINALYFRSSWLNTFDPQHTQKRKFHNANNIDTYVPTMFKKFHLPHGNIESLDANFIKMKYLNEQFEMIIILPNERYGLPELEKKFRWDLVRKATYETKEVELSLPKFKIEATVNLKTILSKLGINIMFEKQANFSLIADKPLYVDKVLQKLFVEVDEKGSEAAVATVVQMRLRRMIVDAEIFVVDHPFMFIIHHKPSSIPLFIGSIRQLGETLNKDEL